LQYIPIRIDISNFDHFSLFGYLGILCRAAIDLLIVIV